MQPTGDQPGHKTARNQARALLTPSQGAGAFVLGCSAAILGAAYWTDLLPPNPLQHPIMWAGLALSGLGVYGLLRLVGASGPSADDFPYAFWLLDEGNLVRGWNRQAEALTLGDDDWSDRDFVHAVPPDFQTDLADTLAKARQNGRAAISTRLRTTEGISVPCRGHAVLNKTGLAIALWECGEETQAQEHLYESENNLRQMIDLSPHLNAIIADGQIVWINATGCRLLGGNAPAALIGRRWSDFLTPGGLLRSLGGEQIDAEISQIPTLYQGRAARIVQAHDVTVLHAANASLNDAERHLNSLWDVIEDCILILGSDGRIVCVNKAASRLSGYEAAELTGQPIANLIAPDALETLKSEAAKLLSTGDHLDLHNRELRIRRKDGSIIPVQIGLSESRAGDRREFTVVVRDLSERNNLHARLSISEKVLESTSEGVMVTARDGTIVWVNGGFSRISGYPREEVIGHNASLLKSGLQGAAFYKAMWTELASKGEWSGEIWNRRKDGEAFPEWLTIKAVPDQSGRIDRYVGVFSDISKHKRAEETIRHLTYYDPVTRLPNRYLFQDRIGQALERARRTERKVALVLVSLDRFKTVNETLGHQVGDDLLREVAGRLMNSVRAEDTVSRLRGDTFCCVLLELGQSHDANPVINRILDCFAQPFMIGGHELFITASLGISIFPLDATEIDDLIQKAETAMNRSKERAENTYHFYTPEMNANSMERLRLETDLRKAIHRGELVLHYQPKVEAATGRLLGAEALVRWRHPEYGMVPPIRFIPIAEDTGLILPIGAHVLREACDQVHVWRQMGLKTVRVAVNISAHQFRQPDLVDSIQRILELADIPASMIELELTESAVMRNADAAVQVLTKLHDLGFEIAIDDFGTGYSSLSYLKRFPIDRLKIDKSFVQDLGISQTGEGIVGAIIAMAHNLKMSVIAEGVETAQQLSMLTDLKCDEIQGYYFSKPLPPEEFAECLKAGVLIGHDA